MNEKMRFCIKYISTVPVFNIQHKILFLSFSSSVPKTRDFMFQGFTGMIRRL